MKFAPVLASALAVAPHHRRLPASLGLYEEAGFAPVVGQEVKLTPALRRQLQTNGSGTTEAPTTTQPTPTTATPTTTSPTPTTATPTTTAPTPTPTTATPTPTTDAPTSTAATETPDATTATPTSTTATPEATTATPSSTTETTGTPSSTTAAPTATSTASSTSSDTTTTPSATESATASNSGPGSSASAGADTSSDSSMSTGAVIGIVVGIVAAVAIIATIIMCVIRRRREADDDPLSPFELSMDKGYNPTPGGFTAQNSYNPRAMGAAGASASGSNTRTPPADTVAAGVGYSQFYDNAATSPDSMNRLESNVDSVQTDPGNNPKESPRSSRNSSRNSYELSSNHNVDADQSSQISGHSNNKSDDFPDHHDDNDSARGSYEL
ncbi:hypothetical protein GQ600_7543 [Phytophthora cactorum]|nr:hypothetical protein GQ600_7543 [Phytophthora cactorum]